MTVAGIWKCPCFHPNPLRQAFATAAPDYCVECDRPVRHAFDRYFQRNDHTDPDWTRGGDGDLLSALLGLTYDTVCGLCGDRALADEHARNV